MPASEKPIAGLSAVFSRKRYKPRSKRIKTKGVFDRCESAQPPGMETTALFAAAFLLGGIPFGFLAGRFYGVDVREVGSGNIGATNVLRSVGKLPGVVTLILDIAKGLGPVIVGFNLGGARLAAGAGVSAVLGHVFCPYLGFRGGKGVATAAGAVAGLAPIAFGLALASFLAGLAVFRKVGLASSIAAVALPVVVMLNDRAVEVQGSAWAVSAVVLIRHTSHLKGLLLGQVSPPSDLDPSRGLPDGGH